LIQISSRDVNQRATFEETIALLQSELADAKAAAEEKQVRTDPNKKSETIG